jgi:DNA-damage-inducible protein D
MFYSVIHKNIERRFFFMDALIKNNQSFEEIKHVDENGGEFWYARELMEVLDYSLWQNFEKIINKAKVACTTSNVNAFDHFIDVNKMVKIGSSAKREQQDYKLSRYACYLIAQNGDSRKRVIALAQTYFAVQTRRQELSEKEYSELTEDEKRFYQRDLTRKGNYSLNVAAKNAGVKNFDKFHNAGYKGLYNGETADDIAKRKGLRYREDILDNMGSDELIANLFRISQTEQKLKKDNISGEKNANETHYEVGKKVRKAIADIGGTMPEDLPTPSKSLKELEKENNKKLKELNKSDEDS